jgi:4-nitrophenyl phosphatase
MAGAVHGAGALLTLMALGKCRSPVQGTNGSETGPANGSLALHTSSRNSTLIEMYKIAELTEKDVSWLRRMRGLIIDMDGVLWQGERPFPGLADFFDVIRRRDLQFVLATNNPAQSIAEFAAKANQMGVPVQPEQIISSATATIYYLREHYPPGSPFYVIGEPVFLRLFEEAGFTLRDSEVVAVVVGMDESLIYEKLRRASLLIRAGASFIGTNPDRYAPWIQGLEPGTGAILAAIEASTDRSPLIIGKPERWMYQCALECLGVPAEKVASLGDRLETDILGGQQAGLRSILVLAATPDCAQLNPAGFRILRDRTSGRRSREARSSGRR